MTGSILDYEAKRIWKEGQKEGIIDTLVSLVRDGILTVSDAASRAGLSESAFRKYVGADSSAG